MIRILLKEAASNQGRFNDGDGVRHDDHRMILMAV